MLAESERHLPSIGGSLVLAHMVVFIVDRSHSFFHSKKKETGPEKSVL